MAFDAIHFAVFTGAWVLAAVLILLIVRRFAKRIGGVTGDIVGFSIEAAQLVFLVLCAAVQSALC
jgi:cobalamin synthase